MTQGIEKMLNLPALEDVLREQNALPSPPPEPPPPSASLDGQDHAEAMDLLFARSLRHADDMMELGFNIDHARARGIFEVAGSFYKNAIDAKNSKRDAQLKAMKLALDARKLELDAAKTAPTRPPVNGEASVIVEDRNELVRRAIEQRRALKP